MSASATAATTTSTDFPVAAIVCLAVGGYTALILIIICVRQILLSRGVCSPGCDCAPCGKEGQPQCSDCCISIAEGCNCCNPSVDGCLKTICPNRKTLSCVDILLCQCFSSENNCFTNTEENVLCGNCACDCSECDVISCPECATISCCCFEIKLKQGPVLSPVEPFTVSQPCPLPQPSSHNESSISQHSQFQLKEVGQIQSQQTNPALHVSWKNNEQTCHKQQYSAQGHSQPVTGKKIQSRRPLPPPPPPPQRNSKI